MSWNPLRKLPFHQRPELDSATQSANEALEKLIVEFDGAENVTKLLHQAIKKLPDHMLCTGKFETKLTDDLSRSNVFSNDEFMTNIIEEWHNFTHVSSTIGDEYVIMLQKSLIEPLKQLKNAFAELRSAIRLHDAIQFDVIKYQRKVASYCEKEKTGTNLVKLDENRQALQASLREFSKRTQILVNDLNKFLSGSLEMLQPLLEGFIAAEIAWIKASKRCMDTKSHIASATSFDSQSDRMKTIEEKFRSISSLSICSPEIK